MATITQTQTIYIKQGATYSQTFTVKDDAGDAVDLTDYTVSAQLSKGYASTNDRVSFTATITSASTGVITLSLPFATTETLDAPARYVYDIEITYTDSTVTRVFEGIADISPGVTS